MRKFALAALATAALSTGALAQSSDMTITKDTVLGTTMEEVTAALTKMGYEVRKSEMEDGEMEVYFVGDGKKGEVYVSQETGKPTKIKVK